MTLRRYKVALIGCGDIAEKGHLPAILKHPRFELRALCDHRVERTRLLAAIARISDTCTDYQDLLGRPDIDAVILALHPEVSVDIVVEFLHGGKAVMDEKPLAVTLADGTRVAEAVRTTGGVYQIGFTFRYCRQVSEVAEYVRKIGLPAQFRIGIFDELLDRSNQEHFQRIQQILRTSSTITHEGSHCLDYFQQWDPSPFTRAYAAAIRTEPDLAGPNLWNAGLLTAAGSTLTLELGWLLPDLPPRTLHVVGPHGYLFLNRGSGEGEFSHLGKAHAVKLPQMIQEWDTQLDVFAAAIDQGHAVTASVEDGLRALRATSACEQAQRTGELVPL